MPLLGDGWYYWNKERHDSAAESFRELLWKAREEALFPSFVRLASELGIAYSTVTSWTRGKRADSTVEYVSKPKLPNPEHLEKLCDYLEACVPGLGIRAARIAGWQWVADIGLPESLSAVGTTPPTNLPTPVTRLIGRDSELNSAIRALRSTDVRLLTFVGLGGIGKTRLACEVGTALLNDFQDGVFLIRLAAVRKPETVAAEILRELGLRELEDAEPSVVLKQQLRARNLLLILDGFEGVLEARALVRLLLDEAPRVKALVTSHSPLHLYGEQLLPVPSLDLPDLDNLPGVEDLRNCSSVKLFIERTCSIKPEFALNEENSVAVAEICVRVDGIPLAIELAAARMKLFSPQVLRSRLDSRLELLTGGAFDQPVRHQTLRNAIAWSYDLLTDSEQEVFRQLSVFVSGFTLDAAQLVCTLSTSTSVMETIASLLDKCLLSYVEYSDGTRRYFMLDTIREYAVERLRGTGREETLHQFHAEWCLAFVRDAWPRLLSGQRDDWLDQLNREQDNIRSAIRWSIGSNNIELALMLVGFMSSFWAFGGYYREGHDWLRKVLALSQTDEVTETHARAHLGLGAIERLRGHYREAEEELRRSVEMWRRLDPSAPARHELALALMFLGLTFINEGNFLEGAELESDSIAVFRAHNDKWGEALAETYLAACVAGQGDFVLAYQLYTRSMETFLELGDPWAASLSLHDLGVVSYSQGKFQQAEALLLQSLQMRAAQKVNDLAFRTMAYHHLGRTLVKIGNRAGAADYFSASIRLAQSIEDRGAILRNVEGLAALVLMNEEPILAARLIGIADKLLAMGAGRFVITYAEEYAQTVSAVRASISPEEFEEGLAFGTAQREDAILAWILAEFSSRGSERSHTGMTSS